MTKKRLRSDSAQVSEQKRLRLRTPSPSDFSPNELYDSYAIAVGTWPEILHLAPNLPLDAQLCTLQDQAQQYFTADLTLTTYQRLYFLEQYLQQIDAEGCKIYNACPASLQAVFDVAATLPITLQQLRFDFVELRPSLLSDAILLAKTKAVERDATLDNSARETVNHLGRYKEGVYLNDEVINFLLHEWSKEVDDTFKIVSSWWPTTYLLGRDGRPSRTGLARIRETLRKGKKKSIFGFNDIDDPRTWARVSMPLHKDKNHWVALVADFLKGKIMVLDSLGCDEVFEREVCQIFREIMTLVWNNSGILSPPVLLQVSSKTSRQENLIDCGIHTLAWMEYLAQGGPLPEEDAHVFPQMNLRVSSRGYRLYFAHQTMRYLQLV